MTLATAGALKVCIAVAVVLGVLLLSGAPLEVVAVFLACVAVGGALAFLFDAIDRRTR